MVLVLRKRPFVQSLEVGIATGDLEMKVRDLSPLRLFSGPREPVTHRAPSVSDRTNWAQLLSLKGQSC